MSDTIPTKKHTITIPILNDEYKVVVCWGNVKQIKKVIKEWDYPDDIVVNEHFFDNRFGVTLGSRERHPIILLPHYPTTAQDIATLTHEACHAITEIFKCIGETSFDEVYAHSVGAIVRQVLLLDETFPHLSTAQ